MLNIIKYKQTLNNFTLEELITTRTEMQAALMNMMLNEELITKIVIVDNLIKEKEEAAAHKE